jgi:2-hydroxy-3-oxopropionate reductase
MEKIGFIGLGIMGKPIAKNLLKAGYNLNVLDINLNAVEELVKEGATPNKSPKQVAEDSDVAITVLPDSPEVEQVVFEPGGVIEGIRSGMLFIDMSTIAPATSRKVYKALKKKDAESLDAPVSGGEVGAIEATLSIMVGGLEDAFQRALPIFNILGKNIVHIGEASAGQVAKACNQVIVGITIQAVAEAMILAKKAGVDTDKVRNALLGGFAQSRILELHGKRIIDQDFKPGFTLKLHRKDMNIALETGRDLLVPLSATALVAVQMDALLALGKGDLDHSALGLLMEKLANTI